MAGPAFAEGALMFSIAGLLFVLTQLLQLVDGYSPLQAGLRTAPAALGSLLTGAPGVWIAKRYGQHRCAAIGYLLCAAGLIVAGVTIAGPYWQLAIGLVVFGAGLRMAMTPVALAVINAMPKENAGMGSALNDTFQEIGGALGVAVLGSLLNSAFRSHLFAYSPAAAHQPLTHVLASGNAGLVTVAHHAFRDGAQLAFAVTAVLMVIAAAVALCTVPRQPTSVAA
jgi:MFS transporter, DHA2 family, multidrug resistance protein